MRIFYPERSDPNHPRRDTTNSYRIEQAWAQFLLPLGLVAIAAAFRAAVTSHLQETPYVIFFPVVIISALYCGLWPGLFATVLSAIAASIWFGPDGSVQFDIPGHSAGLTIFLVGNIIIAGICSRLRSTQQRILAESRRLRQSEQALEAEITERKRAEKALKDAHDQLEIRIRERAAEVIEQAQILESFFRHTQTCLVFLDREFNFIRVNEAYAAVCGRDVSDFPGHNHFVDYPSEELKGKFQRVVDTREPYAVFGRPFVFPDHPEWGVTYWDLSVAPIVDGDGEVELLIFSLLDVTARKQAEEELRQHREKLEELVKERTDALQQSLRRFELLAATAGELLQATEPQKAVESTCRKVMEYLDCHAFFNFLVDEQAGRLRLNACAGIPEEEVKRVRWLAFGTAVCGCVARDGQRIVAEHIPSTPDERTELAKSYGINAYCCHPLLGPGGRVIGTLSFGTKSRETFSKEDVSLMKALTDQVAVAMIRMSGERAMRDSEERLKRSQEIAHLGSWELDLVSSRLYWSDEVYRIFGLRPQEFGATYEAFLEAVHPDDRAAVDAAYSGSLREGKDAYEIEHRVVRKSSGEVRIVHEKCEHIRDESGRIIRSVGMVHDITERKRAEEELRNYSLLLEQSNRDLQDFAFIASHDLQEPLRKVIAFGEILKTNCGAALDEKGNDYLARMVGGAERMRYLIEELLLLSRVTTRALPFLATDLGAVVRDALEDLEERLRTTGGEVRLGELPVIEADKVQMRQLFQNLISNALKFHRKEECPVVHVTASIENDLCAVTVKDNGIGFDMKFAERIFRPFQRLHGRGVYEGSGMGLTICKKIVDRHGGEITVESEPGKGTAFTIKLPVHQSRKENHHG